MKNWDPNTLKSREAQFLHQMVIDNGLDKVKHPVFGALMTQMIKMLSILDDDESYQAKIRGILDRIKENW